MIRRIALALLLLAALGAYLTAWGPPAVAQLPIGAVRIMDGVHNQLATVNHTGQLLVSASVDTLGHLSSVMHVAAAGGGLVIRDPINPNARARVDHTGALVTSASVSVSTDTVNVFHQSTIRHISSVTHIGGFIGIRDGLCLTCWARVDHTGALVTSASVTTTVDNVNVFHQSTIRHISSVTHIGGFIGIRDGLCLTCWARVDHTGALVTSASVTTTVDNVNVFHQSTVRHISSLTHVVIVDWQRWAHVAAAQSGAWSVTAHAGTGAFQVTQSGTWTVQAAHLAGIPSVSQGSVWSVAAHAQQSGAWTIQGAHQAGEWNVRHVTSVVHVAIVQGSAGGASHLLVAPVYQGGTWTVQPGNTANTTAWLTRNVAGQSGSWTIQAAHQGGNWAIGHISSVTHVSGLVSIRDDNCLTCRMRIDHYNALVVQPHISGALRTWQVTSCGTTASLAINTNANRRDLWVMNRGNGNIYVGYGVTGHVALTTANGWPLHATASAITTTARHSTALSTVYLQNYQGPLACISDLAGQTLQVMEILR